MKAVKLFTVSAVLMICGAVLFSSCNCKCKKQHLQPTDDSSQFVVITDVVPDAILEIRYFGTYNFVGARIE